MTSRSVPRLAAFLLLLVCPPRSTSDPDGAEIYVDEKFVGNAPAKLKLGAGSHIMVIKAAGFAEWKRTLEILKDSQVTLKPVLDRVQ